MKLHTILFLLIVLAKLPAMAQWTPIPLQTKASFRAIRQIKNEIWIGGTLGTIVHSSNGGISWKELQVPGADNLDFRDLALIDQQKVLLMSAGPADKGAAKLYYSKDHGQSWSILFEKKSGPYFFDAIAWNQKKQEGVMLSDPMNGQFPLFKIENGGEKVKEIKITSFPTLLQREAAFAASGSSILWINGKLNLVTGGSAQARILQSQDETFTKFQVMHQSIPADSSSGFFSIGARNKSNYWVVGGNYLRLNGNNIGILESKDAGLSWHKLSDSPSFYMEKVLWTGKYWVVVGPSKSAAYDPKNKKWISLGETHFHNVLLHKKYLFAVGSKGTLAKISLADLDQLFLSKK
ncbi:YCF48-related protein [Aquirufa salirivi]|uniref:YCF48-related protein n=1 Tax=Aquirufa salirivi TaxID=3104729 RepID=A0ABW8RX09_9BACT